MAILGGICKMKARDFNAMSAKSAPLPLDDSPKSGSQFNGLPDVCVCIVKTFYNTRSRFVYFVARSLFVNLEVFP